jgi:hypothetical protein
MCAPVVLIAVAPSVLQNSPAWYFPAGGGGGVGFGFGIGFGAGFGIGFGWGFGFGLVTVPWCVVVRGAAIAARVTGTVVVVVVVVAGAVVVVGTVVVGTVVVGSVVLTVVVVGCSVVVTGATFVTTTGGTVAGVPACCRALPNTPASTKIASTTAPVIHGQRRRRFGLGGGAAWSWPYGGFVIGLTRFRGSADCRELSEGVR